MKQKMKQIYIYSMISVFLCSCGLTDHSADLLHTNTVNHTESSTNEQYADFHIPAGKEKVMYGGNSESNMVTIDASDICRGYIMVKCENGSEANKKVIIQGPSSVKYTYDLNTEGEYDTFILSDGEGQYSVGVYENIEGSKYSTLFHLNLDVQLIDPYIPFLSPNQYVNYTMESQAVKLAEDLTTGMDNDLEKVQTVYHYVIENISYDKQKAQSVKSGYLPNIDTVLQEKKGICFDYAALMTAMLRSQNIPTKLVTGFTGSTYHAWISTYTEETGWVEGVIYFDGTTWKLLDPTFASSEALENNGKTFVGNSRKYVDKYIY